MTVRAQPADPAVAALAERYFNSDDRKQKEELARMILDHFLALKDGAGLARALAPLDRDFFARALRDAAGEGADLTGIAVDAAGVLGPKPVAEALGLSIERDRSRLAAVFAAIGATPALLEPVLEKAVELGADLAAGLAWLTERHLQQLLHPLRSWAQRGADLSVIAPKLERGFGGERGVAVLSASTLTFVHLHRNQLESVASLLGHASQNVRWGAVRALWEFLLAHPRSGPLVDALALALSDEDPEVRGQAALGLRTLRKADHALFPSPQGLEKIAATLGTQPEVMEVVYGWVAENKQLAAATRDWLTRHGGHPRLLAICEEVVAGTHPLPCPICSKLEEFECAGHEEDLPKATQLLIPKDAELRACPSCGTRYTYGWDEQYEDEFGSHGTYDVRRLDPLPGSKTLDQLRGDLAHPTKRVRKEAAGELTGLLLAQQRWEELRALLGDPAFEVRLKALLELRKAGAGLAPLVGALRERLREQHDDIQHSAATLLARQFIQERDYPALGELLSIDARMVRWATANALDAAAKAAAFDLGPLEPKLTELAGHPDDFVHGSARRALGHLGPRPAPPGAQAAGLDSADTEVRKRASDHFATQALLGKDISAHAVRLAQLLADPDFEVRRNAFQALNWAADEFDLTACLPTLDAHLKAHRECEHVLQLLQTMQVQGGQSISSVLPGVIAALPACWYAVGVLEVLFRKGEDLGAATQALLQSLEAPKLEHLHDRQVVLLVEQWLKSGAAAQLERLLLHPRARVRKAALCARLAARDFACAVCGAIADEADGSTGGLLPVGAGGAHPLLRCPGCAGLFRLGKKALRRLSPFDAYLALEAESQSAQAPAVPVIADAVLRLGFEYVSAADARQAAEAIVALLPRAELPDPLADELVALRAHPHAGKILARAPRPGR